MSTRPVTRFHPLLVTLHWLLALLIVAMLTIGFGVLAAMPNSDPQKVGVLRIHMAVGMLVLVLMLVRLAVRLCTAHPQEATTGHPGLDRAVPLFHLGLYGLVVLMVGTGYATGIIAGLPAIVFGGSGDPLPADFSAYPTFTAHSYLALVLAGCVGLHVLAAYYHQFVMRDRLFGRMGFGRRSISEDAESPTAYATSRNR